MLLTREQFRAAVFARDNHECVICLEPGQDAHHIIERRLWPDGGYYLDNGATLCGKCHLDAESTLITCEAIRIGAKIQKVLLPPHLYPDTRYDKWGNPFLDGQLLRLKGELFEDESVQKALARVVDNPDWAPFTNRVKYPRTYHLPWSPGLTSDDRRMDDLSELEGHDIVVTIKMDGEQTTFYHDGYCHARSVDSGSHQSRNWIKAVAGRVGPQLPTGWRVCGENLWAAHSIQYKDLTDYFLVFSVWNGLTCLSWKETEEWAALLGLHTVQKLDENWNTLPSLGKTLESRGHEGYVVRRADSFHYRDFRKKVGKYVRASHVHTHGHWMRSQIERNTLSDEAVLRNRG